MGLVLLIFGMALIDVSLRGTEREMAKQMAADFGQGQFWAAAGAISIVGAFGYIRSLRTVSDGFLVLIFFMWTIGNREALPGLAAVFTSPPSPATAVPLPAAPSVFGGSSGSGSSKGGGIGGGSSGGSGSLLNTALSIYGGGGAGGGSTVGEVAALAALA